MPSSLTATKIKDTYGQVLHVDGGVTSTLKLVYDGDGTATALKVSTTDVQVNNSPVLTDADIGSTVQAYDADLTAWSGKTAPSGTVVGTTDAQTLTNKTVSGPNGDFVALEENNLPVVSQADIGTAPNEVPINGYLGGMAFQSPEAVVLKPQASVTPVGIGDMTFQLTNNTTLAIKVKGSDGTVRSATLTLA